MKSRWLLGCLLAIVMAFVSAAALAQTVSDIQALNDALISGGEITLGADIVGSITIGEGVTVTLNLNGHKLTNTDGQHTIINKGTLTIIGEGTVDNVSHGRGAIYNDAGATATLKGGTYTRSKENGVNKEENGGNSWYTVKNFGTMTIENGVTIGQNGKYSSLIANGWQNGAKAGSGSEPAVQNGGAELIINGGTFTGGLNTIKNDDYGKLTINGGTFENFAQAAFLNWNEALVTGGTFKADDCAAILNSWCDDEMDQGKLTISGGEFTGAYFLQNLFSSYHIGDVQITGGTFEGGMDVAGDIASGTVAITGGSFTTTPASWTTTNAALTVSGGEYTDEVPEAYIVAGRTSASLTSQGTTTYYIGTSEEVADKVAKASDGDTITVLAGSLSLSDPAVGVTITNKGDGTVKAGSETVSKNESVTVAPAATAVPTAAPTATPAPAKSVPKTGDSNRPFLWLGLLLASAAVAGGFLLYRKRYQ